MNFLLLFISKTVLKAVL